MTSVVCSFVAFGGERERERNVLFNDALNTFYLRLYGVRHMVKDHSDSEKGNPLPPHRLLLSINSKGSFICTIPTDRITHTTAFVTPVVEHWLEREIAQWVHPMKDRFDDPLHHERTLYLSYVPLLVAFGYLKYILNHSQAAWSSLGSQFVFISQFIRVLGSEM